MSMYYERFVSMIRREVEHTVRKLHKPPRIGLVSSYDKKHHAVKVKLQPEGTETGWIPLTGFAIGNNFGILSAPFINDQVIVEFEGGDHMVARVSSRHFSDLDKPPQIDPGEHQFTHQSGSTIYMKKDGTVIIGGASTMTTGPIGQGQSGNLSTGKKTGETGQQQQQQTPQQPNAKQTITLKPDGTMVIDVPNNDFNVTVDQTNFNVTTGKKVNITAQGDSVNIKSNSKNINLIADSGTIVHAAQTVSLDAPVVLVESLIIQGDIEPA